MEEEILTEEADVKEIDCVNFYEYHYEELEGHLPNEADEFLDDEINEPYN